MRKVVLSTLAAAALTFDVLPDSNIAYRRAVYQSSAADFTHVGHLVTDGVKSAEPLQITETRVELPGKSPDNERAKCATDGRADTKWVVFAPSCWIEVVLPSPAKATSYSVTTANDESRRDPKVWRVLGSVDGKKYVELASMDDPKFHRRHERKTWKIDRPGDYRFYRFAIDSNGGGVAQDRTTPCTQIAEFDVLDADGKSLVRSGGEEGFASRWVSKTGRDEWLKIDLGAPSRVDSVKVDWTKGGEAAEWRIELSSDGVTWTKGAKGGDVCYVRLVCVKARNAVFAVDEITVTGENALKPAETGWRLAPAREVSASGAELSQAGYDDSAWLPAVVPGTVLTSYLKAGAIPDMNFADNQLMISDGYFYDDFWYRHAFTVPERRRGLRTWLSFEAVNWKADVYLNGQSLGSINGAFLRRKFDVTSIVRPGAENHLAVKIHKNANPGAVTVQDRNSPGLNGGVLGRDNPTIHASIGWDWVPTVRGRNIGIYRGVKVAYSRDVTLSDGWVVTDLDVASKDFSRAKATVRVRAHNASDTPTDAAIEATLEPGGYALKADVKLAAGETREVEIGTVTMKNPKLWWPATYGEQPLYTATIIAKTVGKVSDRHSFKFGVRKFSYSDGKPLEIYCNGVRIVCRGGNWGMDDANLAATPFDYDTKVRLHAEANLTMIRNWVGMTNSDDFYKACDKYGVLVWDDFWLANPADGPDPADPAMFLENARDKILKNRHHASIPLYCARNEGNPPRSLFDELPDWAFGPFVRPRGVNPVISPNKETAFDCPMRKRPIKWEESDTFNPAAAVKDGKIVVLYRAEDNTAQGIGSRTSRLGYAETTDGVTMKRDPKPVMFPCEDDQKEFDWMGGCEDPRIAMTEDGLYVMTYTSWNRKIARLCVATSRDLKHWKKHGPAFARLEGERGLMRGCKSGAILQKRDERDPDRWVIAKIGGRYIMYWGEGAVNVATSENLVDWQNTGSVMTPRAGFFDSSLTEVGPAALLTEKGIVVFYNGKNSNGDNADARYPRGVYCGGQALFDRKDPWKFLDRLDVPYFKPEADFEKTGQYRDGTVFTEGLVFFKGKWHLYYGCADSFVGYAVWEPK